MTHPAPPNYQGSLVCQLCAAPLRFDALGSARCVYCETRPKLKPPKEKAMAIELDASKVSPKTHRFVGVYRPPLVSVDVGGTEQCPGCGALNFREKPKVEHWLAGHFDVPQWELLEEKQSGISQRVAKARRYDEVVEACKALGLVFGGAGVLPRDVSEHNFLISFIRERAPYDGGYSEVLKQCQQLGFRGALLWELCEWISDSVAMKSLANAEWRRVWELCLRLGMQVKQTDSQWENVEKFLCHVVGKAEVPTATAKAAKAIRNWLQSKTCMAPYFLADLNCVIEHVLTRSKSTDD